MNICGFHVCHQEITMAFMALGAALGFGQWIKAKWKAR